MAANGRRSAAAVACPEINEYTVESSALIWLNRQRLYSIIYSV